MGDQKDHISVQKKETESFSNESDIQEFENTAESLPPPALQFKNDNSSDQKEDIQSEYEDQEALQFAMPGPPNENDESESKLINNQNQIGRGIAEPFRIPTVQKKKGTFNKQDNLDNKPSFKP